jgi:hypothetical protein
MKLSRVRIRFLSSEITGPRWLKLPIAQTHFDSPFEFEPAKFYCRWFKTFMSESIVRFKRLDNQSELKLENMIGDGTKIFWIYKLAVWLSIWNFYSHLTKVTRKCDCYGRIVVSWLCRCNVTTHFQLRFLNGRNFLFFFTTTILNGGWGCQTTLKGNHPRVIPATFGWINLVQWFQRRRFKWESLPHRQSNSRTFGQMN